MLLPSVASGRPLSASTPVLVFISGWPDDERSFAEVAKQFGDDYHTLSMCLPGYSENIPQKIPRWGYSFEAVTKMLRETIKDQVGEDRRVTLVGHDWGAYFCFAYAEKYPSTVDKFVSLDVGPYSPTKDMAFKDAAVDFLYKGCLALGFVLRALGFPTAGAFLVSLFPWKLLGPCPNEPKVPERTKTFFTPKGFNIATCYPYLYVFANMAAHKGTFDWPVLPKNVPILFIHGTKKRINFHSPAFVASLQQRNDHSKAIPYDCGHFIQAQKPNDLVRDIKAFLEDDHQKSSS